MRPEITDVPIHRHAKATGRPLVRSNRRTLTQETMELSVRQLLQSPGDRLRIQALLQQRPDPSCPEEEPRQEIVQVPIDILDWSKVTKIEATRLETAQALDTPAPLSEIDIRWRGRWKDKGERADPDTSDVASEDGTSGGIQPGMMVRGMSWRRQCPQSAPINQVDRLPVLDDHDSLGSTWANRPPQEFHTIAIDTSGARPQASRIDQVRRTQRMDIDTRIRKPLQQVPSCSAMIQMDMRQNEMPDRLGRNVQFLERRYETLDRRTRPSIDDRHSLTTDEEV